MEIWGAELAEYYHAGHLGEAQDRFIGIWMSVRSSAETKDTQPPPTLFDMAKLTDQIHYLTYQ
jgi:hypothetical protein